MSELNDKERIDAIQNAFIEKLNQVLDFIPGYRGYRRGVENAVGMVQGKPSNYSAADYARDLGYSMVPFYGAYDNYINDQPQDWKTNALEATLMFAPIRGYKFGEPVKGPRRAVAVDEAGKPNLDDLMEWGKAKHEQYYPLQNSALRRDRARQNIEDYDEIINGITETINNKRKQINGYKRIINGTDELPQIKEELARDIPKLEDEITQAIERRNNIDNERMRLIMDRVDGEPFNYTKAMEELGGPWTDLGNPYRADLYLKKKLTNEYGEGPAEQYYNALRYRRFDNDLDLDSKHPFSYSWESLKE